MSSSPAYMTEPWFAMLQSAKERSSQAKVAAELGLSPGAISQVLNGTGLYGTGKASTQGIAEKVQHTYGAWLCPHLAQQGAADPVITAERCRAYAHRTAPSSSPRDLQHWQACNACPKKAHSAPPHERYAERHAKRPHRQPDPPTTT